MTVIYGSFGRKMATKYLHYGFAEKANAPPDVSNSILRERGADCARMRGGQDYFLDLLFYHLRLGYVVIDLKIEEFKPPAFRLRIHNPSGAMIFS